MIFFRATTLIFLAIHTIFFGISNGTQPADHLFSSPRKRMPFPVLKPSPATNTTYLTNFHKKMIAALDCEDFTTFAELLNNYLMLVPYDLVIKEKAFFLSLFYLIFELISGTQPQYSHFYKTLTSFIKTSAGKVYALEFSFSDGKKKFPTMLLSNSYNPCSTIPIIHIVCNLSSPHDIKIFGTRSEKSRHHVFVEIEDVQTLSYNQDNFARNILSILEDCIFDQSELEKNLSDLYNTLPREFFIEKEKYFQALFVLMMTFVRSGTTQHEIVSSIGRSDVMISSDEVINVIEFKHKKSVAKALQQIRDMRYCSIYHLQKKSIRMVGINISYETSGCARISIEAEPYNVPSKKPFQWIGKKIKELPSTVNGKCLFPPPELEF